jgi:uncharacterized protein YkwD
MEPSCPSWAKRVCLKVRVVVVAALIAALCPVPAPAPAVATSTGQFENDASLFPEPLAVVVPNDPTSGANTSVQHAAAQTNSPTPTYAEQMVLLVNAFRAQNGLPPLKADPALGKAGQDYATRLGAGNFFGHNDPDFGCNKASERAVSAGYTFWSLIGENLAAGYATAESAINALSQSSGHRANMLHAGFREIGVGYMYDGADAGNVRQGGSCPYANAGGPYRYYWSQEFGSRYVNGLPHLPVIINGEAVTTSNRTVSLYVYGGITGQVAWAQYVRFSSDGLNWSAYVPWTATATFTLPAGTGPKTVYAQIANGGTTQTVSDTIYLIDSANAQPSPSPSPNPDPNATPTPTATPSGPLLPRNYIPVINR